MDITERKRAEEVLRESEERYRELIEKMQDGVYRSSHGGKFLEVNPAMVKILGYDSKEELLAIDIKNQLYFAVEDRESAALEEKLEEMAVFRLKKKDGSEIWVEDHGRHVFDEEGNVLYHEGILRDVTERKQVEFIIGQQNQQLKELNETKDKFFSIIAHDLRSPFHGFLNMTALMSEKQDEFTTEELAMYMGEMSKSTKNLYTLLQNLLEWAQMQNGAMDFSPNEFIINKYVDANIKTIDERAKQKGITIINEVPEQQKVFADERMINSIISNLLSNAVKFTKKDGAVTIKAKKIDDEMVEISVQDAGIGMSESTINKLFKIGENIGRNGTDGEPSTGLGLLLCKEFVEKHGGKIWAESKENIGSTFYFTLPQINKSAAK